MLKIPNAIIEKAPGAIWASAITGADVSFQNAQSISYIITSGSGTAANVTCKVMAKQGSGGDAVAVDFLCGEVGGTIENVAGASGKSISIGGAENQKAYIVTITADMLAGTGYDTVYITTTEAKSSTVPGAIVVITGQHRYSN